MIIIPVGLIARTLPGLLYCMTPVLGGTWIGVSIMLLLMMPSELTKMHALSIPFFFGIGYLIRRRWVIAREGGDGESGPAYNYAVFGFMVLLFSVSLATGLFGGKNAVDSKRAKIAEAEDLAKAKATREAAALASGEIIVPPPEVKKVATVSGQPPSRAIAAALPLLKLKSILGSEKRRTALINSTPLSIGETSNVKTEGATIKVRCIDITENSVQLELNDSPDFVELRLE